MHHAQVRQALLAGKDVFVEKPLALRYDEDRELVELARAHGAILMVGHVLEYLSAVVLLKDTVARGELGRVWHAYSNRLNLGKVRREEKVNMFDLDAKAAGYTLAPGPTTLMCATAAPLEATA